ncbi:MAG: hypothetical protein ACREQI_08950 [Candidatus Binataceae bacterium]
MIRLRLATNPTIRAALSIAAAAAIALASASSARAQGDWVMLKKTPTPHATPAPRPTPLTAKAKAAAAAAAAAERAHQPRLECGELALPAGQTYRAIVAQLNDMWGANFHVYQSLQPGSPHARAGGCIFYNEQYLNTLLKQWMDINNPDAMKPMLYAVFAHEMGHLAHGDLDPASAKVPVRNKELAADQFAGYSLERLGIPRLDSSQVTWYYQLVGDDFVGAGSAGDSGHGTGAERAAAFNEGWRRAQMGLPEQSDRPSGGLGVP